MLGVDHPLVGVLSKSDAALQALFWVTAAQAAAIVLLMTDHGFGLSLAIADAYAQIALGCRIALLRGIRRDLCIDLIIEGRRRLPLACVQRECRRLCRPGRPTRFAQSIDKIADIAYQPPSSFKRGRPLFDVRVIRPVAPELREIASLLRAQDASVRGVAAVERLLASAASPLYGEDVDPLRNEVWCARYLLSQD